MPKRRVEQPPPSSPPIARTNVIEPPTRFVGRRAELDALARALATARLVTIVGPPGTGKTRLALRFADEWLSARDASASVWLVDLTEAHDADALLATTARVLDVPIDPGTSSAELSRKLGQAIAARRETVLVLDNFEQLVDAGAPIVADWSRGAGDARFLVTSRETLRIAAEQPFELAPLGLPSADGAHDVASVSSSDAVALLLHRAPTFAPTDADAPVLAEIARRLDGIPLALELAATRLPMLGPHTLLARLEGSLDTLGRGPRDANARQATLRAAIDWSWRLLRDAEREALAACAVFHSGFSLEAAEAVLPRADVAVLDVLHALRDKSLLRSLSVPGDAPDPHRFGLYESIRQFAAEKLAQSGASGAVLDRHADHFARVGRVWAEQSNTTAGLRRLVVELDNLQAAYAHCAGGGADDPASASRRLALCLALDPVLSTRGPVDVHLERLDASLAEAARRASSEPELVARALAARGRLRKSRGWIPEALADLQEAASLARGAKLRALEARLDADMGEAHLAQGRMDEALAHFERALGARLVGRDRIVRGRALASLGLLHHGQGRLDRALDAYERAVAVLAELGDDVTRASVLKDIGSLRLQQGRHEEAEAIYRQSLALQRDLGDRRVLGVVLGNLGILAQERGRLEEARTSFERALAHVREVADRMLEGHLLGYLAGLGLERGDLAGARALYLEAIGVLREVGDRRLEGTFRACLGSIEASEGHIDAANEAFEGAETLLEGVGDPALLSACVIHRGHLDLAEARMAAGRGDGASADALRRRARARLDALRPPIDSDDLRFAARLLSRALGEGALVVAADTSWFRVPGGAPVSLETRKPLRFIVAALIERRLAQPGAALSTEALFAAGWPGERALPQASANRVKVALSSLRTMGLRAMLLHGEDGYSLDPAVPVTMEAPAQRP